MSKWVKLYMKARESPSNVTFHQLCSLAEHVGFIFRNQTGSHRTYRHPIIKKTMNFQPGKNGKAKIYQVDQLVGCIEEFNLMGDSENV